MILSIILGLIIGIILYHLLKQKNKIILNYNFELNNNDKIRINNKCSKINN